MGTVMSDSGAATYPDAGCWGNPGFNLIESNLSSVEIIFSVPLLDIRETDLDGETYQRVSLPGVFLPNQAGAPDLPTISRFIAIPNAARAKVEVIEFRTETFSDIKVIPALQIPPESSGLPQHHEKKSHIYSLDEFYPSKPVALGPPTQIRGVDAAILTITPFQYNPSTKSLLVYRDLRVRVTLVALDGSVTSGYTAAGGILFCSRIFSITTLSRRLTRP
jgi:hypothetical protein